MDRQLVYPGQILPETTLLQMTKDAMIGLAKLSAAVLGTSTAVNGFAVTPTSPASLQVYAAPGEIYSLQNIDGTAFSSLAADTTHQILKQGILLDQATLSCPAPATAGQSINYLIEAAYADAVSAPVLLPYYNSTPPNTPFSGQGNNGLTQPTARKGTVVLTAKSGVPAATGSQTTPTPDSGNVGLYVVTVAYGQTQIVAGNISPYSGAPFINMPTMAQIQAQAGTAFAAGGTAPAYTLTPSPAIQGYADKQRFNVTFPSAGTPGSNTINVNGLGAIPLKQYAADGSLVFGIVTAGMNSDVQIVGAGSYALLLDPLPAQALPAGSVMHFAAITAPSGFLKADGSAISRTTYAALFAVLGTTFGTGDGSTTFNLPDLRGEFVRGFDNGRGLDAGRAFGSTQTDALQNITGSASVYSPSSTASATGALSASGAGSALTGGSSVYSLTLSLNASSVARTSTETRPHNVALLACIKY